MNELARMLRPTIQLAFLSLLPMTLWIVPDCVISTTYECLDNSGQTVFTDSPAQLLACKVFDLDSKSPSPKTEKLTFDTPRPKIFTGHREPTDPVAVSPPLALSAFSNLIEPAHSSTPTFVVPIQKIGGSPVVQAKINRKIELNLLLNPGEKVTLLRHEIGEKLGMIPSSSGNSSQDDSHSWGIRIGVLQVGDAQAFDQPVHFNTWSPPNEDIAGILGTSFFDEQYRIIDFNPDLGYLRLQMRLHQ